MTFAPGSPFGPYQILEPLGRGGMATVYKAYEPGLDRYVALKILPSEFLHDEGFAERFRREAKVIARLEHPNIIPIHNFGIDERSRTPWMAMRLIGGGALSGVMKKTRMGAERTITILHGVALALDYAHGKGVIHRDIKPQNILLDEAERVYLADFGIAKMVEGSSGLTATGMISGTPQYMAPEQAMANTVDNRADIYALGIVAYEMLTGRVPFAADTPVAVLMKHVQDPIPIPSAHDVPEPLTRALLKALAKRPEDRWPTAVAFVSALGAGLEQASGPGAASTAFLTEVQAPGLRGAGTPARGTAVNRAPATWTAAAPGAKGAGTPYPGTPYPPPPAPPPGAYPTLPPYPPAPPPLPTGPHSAAYPSVPPSASGPGRALVIGLVASVALAGILGAGILFLLLRPHDPDVPDRTPVTLRPVASADGGGLTTTPLSPPASLAPSPTTATTVPPEIPSVHPSPPAPVVRRASAPSLAPVIATAPPVTLAVPRPTPVAVPPTLPATAEPTRPAAPSFPGAGKVETGATFFEKTLGYERNLPLHFDAHAGAVSIPVVEMMVIEKRRGRKDEPRVEVRAVFPVVDCPRGGGKWSYRVLVALLDGSGRELHRFGGGGSCTSETKTSAASDDVPRVLLGEIRGVRMRVDASKN